MSRTDQSAPVSHVTSRRQPFPRLPIATTIIRLSTQKVEDYNTQVSTKLRATTTVSSRWLITCFRGPHADHVTKFKISLLPPSSTPLAPVLPLFSCPRVPRKGGSTCKAHAELPILPRPKPELGARFALENTMPRSGAVSAPPFGRLSSYLWQKGWKTSLSTRARPLK